MVLLSKLEPGVDVASCRGFIHPWTDSCTLSFLHMIQSSVIGTTKVMTLLYLVQLMMRYKKRKKDPITKQYLKQLFIAYCKSSAFFGSTLASVFIGMHCLLRKLLNRYYYVSVCFIPAFIAGGLSIFTEDVSRRSFAIGYFSNMVIELWIRFFKRAGIIEWSDNTQTFCFMLINSAFMYLTHKYRYMDLAHFWFYTPDPATSSTEGKCCHPGDCQTSIRQKTINYFLTGYIVQLIKSLLSEYTNVRDGRMSLWSVLFNVSNFQLGTFFGSYVFIHQLVTCYLNIQDGGSRTWHQVLAGFLSGLSYRIQPNMTVFNSVLTSLFKVSTLICINKKLIPDLPYGELMFAVSNGFLFHARALDSEICPKLMVKVMTGTTNGRSDLICNNYLKFLARSKPS